MLVLFLLLFMDILYSVFIEKQGRFSFVSLVYICIFIYFFPRKRFREIAWSWPMVIWLLLTFYHLINATIKHVPEINFVDYLRGLKIYASICIYTFLFSNDTKKAVQTVFLLLGAWLLFALILTGYTVGTRLNGTKVIAVMFGKGASLMAIMAIYLAAIRRESIYRLSIRLFFPILIILLAQARNAFGMVVIMFAGYYYAVVMRCKMKFKQLILLCTFCVFFLVSVDYVIANTGLGMRIQNDIESVDESLYRDQYLTGTFFDYIVGERIVYYVTGWEIFISHPITGIGLDNYQDYIQGNYPMHVEYMVHLAEGGIIAFILWISFNLLLIIFIMRTETDKKQKALLVFTFISILFTCAFSVMYDNEMTIMLYGLLLSINYPSFGNFFNKRKKLSVNYANR